MSYSFTIKTPYVNPTKDLATDKIISFSNFEEGWHFGDGEKFSKKVIETSLQIVSFLKKRGFAIIDAFPSINGEIRVTTYPGDYYFAINVNDEYRFTFWIEDKNHNELFLAENLSIEELKKTLITYRLKWSTSEYSPKTTGMRLGKNSMILHSTTHQRREVAVYPLLTSNVQPNRLVEYVDI